MSISGPSGSPSLPPSILSQNAPAGASQLPGGMPFTDISSQCPPQTSALNINLPQLDAPQVNPSGAGTVATLSLLSAQDAQADMYAVMALFTKLAQDQRTAARELRHDETQAQFNTEMQAAQKIRDAAKDRLVGAILSGAMQIGAGAVQIGGAAKSIGTAKGAGDPGKNFEVEMQKAQSIGAGADGISKAMTGMGGILGGVMEHQAALDDAGKAELEAKAKLHDTAKQQAGDLMQQMQDIIRDIRDKLGSMEQSRIETTRGIARNI